jgi:hypothetical protein
MREDSTPIPAQSHLDRWAGTGVVLLIVLVAIAALLPVHAESAPAPCRGGGRNACTPVPTVLATVVVTSGPSPTADPPRRWPVRQHGTPETVLVYHVGQGLTDGETTAIAHAITRWNAAQRYVLLVDVTDVPSPIPCGQNYFTEAVCLQAGQGVATTGIGGFYPSLDTSVMFIRATSTWLDPTFPNWAQGIANLRWNALNPQGGIGWSVQDVMDMAVCHELGHVLGLPEQQQSGITHGCIAGDGGIPQRRRDRLSRRGSTARHRTAGTGRRDIIPRWQRLSSAAGPSVG